MGWKGFVGLMFRESYGLEFDAEVVREEIGVWSYLNRASLAVQGLYSLGCSGDGMDGLSCHP